MSAFTPEYVELCRKLALPREWQKGDWYLVSYNDDQHCMAATPTFPVRKDLTWLPREGDLLDLLEAEDVGLPLILVALHPAKDGSGYGVDTAEGDDGEVYFGSDRKTALLRLLIAGKGVDVEVAITT